MREPAFIANQWVLIAFHWANEYKLYRQGPDKLNLNEFSFPIMTIYVFTSSLYRCYKFNSPPFADDVKIASQFYFRSLQNEACW